MWREKEECRQNRDRKKEKLAEISRRGGGRFQDVDRKNGREAEDSALLRECGGGGRSLEVVWCKEREFPMKKMVRDDNSFNLNF